MNNPITSKQLRQFWHDMHQQLKSEPLYRQMVDCPVVRIGLLCDVDSRIGIVVHSRTPLSRRIRYSNIKIFSYKRDNRYEIILKLLTSDLEFPFSVICAQIINGLSESDVTDGGQYIALYLEKWNNLLCRSRDLSEDLERGLWCELHVLELAARRYGVRKAVSSWVGPQGAPQDFCFEDTYVEVKSVREKAGEVKIASLDQLDPVGPLFLTIVGLEQSVAGLTLKDKVEELKALVTEPYSRELLNEALLMYGFSEEIQRVGSDKKYAAQFVHWFQASDPNFPSLRRSSLCPAILKASYSLSRGSLEQYRTEGLF